MQITPTPQYKNKNEKSFPIPFHHPYFCHYVVTNLSYFEIILSIDTNVSLWLNVFIRNGFFV